MTLLTDWLFAVGEASLDWFWRPLLIWTLIALLFYAGLRLWRSAPPLVQYHAHLALLLALPLSLVLAPFIGWSVSVPEGTLFSGEVPTLPVPTADMPVVDAMPVGVGEGEPLISEAAAPGVVWDIRHGLGLLMVVAAGLATWLLLRMLYLAHGLKTFRQRLSPVEDPRAHRLLGTLAHQLGVRDMIHLYSTPDETTPMTFGWRKPVIVLPASLLDDETALRLTLRHELIHVRRRDYVVSWVVRLVGSLFAIHPGVWLLRRRIDQYREISCDIDTLAETPGDARRYARLLLRFSPLTDLAGPAALCMVERDSTLKKRINAMYNILRFPASLRVGRWSLLLVASALLIPVLFAACSTETTQSETVIVNGEPVDASFEADQPVETIVVEQLEQAQQQHEMAQRERELVLMEQRLALEEAEMRYRDALEVREVKERERQLEQQHAKKNFVRLQVQMEYLQAEIRKISKEVEKVSGPEKDMTYQRYQLLNAMYMQRLEEYETMKMERFTQEALSDLADAE